MFHKVDPVPVDLPAVHQREIPLIDASVFQMKGDTGNTVHMLRGNGVIDCEGFLKRQIIPVLSHVGEFHTFCSIEGYGRFDGYSFGNIYRGKCSSNRSMSGCAFILSSSPASMTCFIHWRIPRSVPEDKSFKMSSGRESVFPSGAGKEYGA